MLANKVNTEKDRAGIMELELGRELAHRPDPLAINEENDGDRNHRNSYESEETGRPIHTKLVIHLRGEEREGTSQRASN